MRSFKPAVLILMIAVVVTFLPAKAAMVPVGEIGLGRTQVIPATEGTVVRHPSEWNAATFGPAVGFTPIGEVSSDPGGTGTDTGIPDRQGRLWQDPPRSLVIDHRAQQMLLTRNIVAQGTITPVPEPSTLILLGLGLAGLGVASSLHRKHV